MNLLLKTMINKKKVVSFDVFDTLIERKVETPYDVFDVVGDTVLGQQASGKFREDRILAEKEARNTSVNGEVTLDEIYAILSRTYPDTAQMLKDEEINQEISLCTTKTNMYPVYEYALKRACRIVLISDMYLPASVIEKMLSKCGINSYSKLYISNEFGHNKLTGELYDCVIKDIGMNKKDMLHIGDSVKADLLGARKSGIQPYLIGRKNRLKRFLSNK